MRTRAWASGVRYESAPSVIVCPTRPEEPRPHCCHLAGLLPAQGSEAIRKACESLERNRRISLCLEPFEELAERDDPDALRPERPASSRANADHRRHPDAELIVEPHSLALDPTEVTVFIAPSLRLDEVDAVWAAHDVVEVRLTRAL